jgi:hypothetical protein
MGNGKITCKTHVKSNTSKNRLDFFTNACQHLRTLNGWGCWPMSTLSRLSALLKCDWLECYQANK